HLRRAQCNEHRILRDRGQSSLCARHHFVRHTVLHLHPCARTAAALVRLVIRRRPVDLLLLYAGRAVTDVINTDYSAAFPYHWLSRMEPFGTNDYMWLLPFAVILL